MSSMPPRPPVDLTTNLSPETKAAMADAIDNEEYWSNTFPTLSETARAAIISSYPDIFDKQQAIQIEKYNERLEQQERSPGGSGEIPSIGAARPDQVTRADTIDYLAQQDRYKKPDGSVDYDRINADLDNPSIARNLGQNFFQSGAVPSETGDISSGGKAEFARYGQNPCICF